MIQSRPNLALRPRSMRECLIDRYAALAAAHGAIDLTLATDDQPAPPELLAALTRALPEAGRYPDFAGEPGLRAAVARERARRDGIETTPAEVVITAGATGGLAGALAALLAPGDELVTFQPGYSIPLGVAEERGARVCLAALRPEGARWTFDLGAVAALFGPRTRVLLLTSPHSPTGKVFTREELKGLAALCRRHGVHIVHDAVYEDFELTLPTLSPRALFPEGTVVASSGSKALRAPGLRVGWVTAPRALAERIAKVQEETTGGASLPAQLALAGVLGRGRGAADRAGLLARHERVRHALERLGLACVPAEGGLCFVARRPSGAGSEELARDLLGRGIASVPLAEFAPDARAVGSAVRIGFARGEAILARLEACAAEAGRGIARGGDG